MGGRLVIVGGGLAGIAAALDLADAGGSVTLLERRAQLGGLARSHDRGGLRIDNGQHVFLRCCTEYLALLDRLGARDLVHLQPRLDVPVLAPGARTAHIRRSRLPAPLHLAATLVRYGHLGPRDRFRVARAAAALRRLDPDDAALDRVAFGDWLRAKGQSPAAVAALWDLVARPTINLGVDDASLALAVRVFRTGLLDSASGGDLGWARVPLGDIHDVAAQRALNSAGVEVVTSCIVDRIADDARHGLTVAAGTRQWSADAIVLTVPHRTVASLVPQLDGTEAGPFTELGQSPIVNVHLFYDRRVTDLPFAAAIDSPVEFVFDRTQSAGFTRGQYLAVSLSAADDALRRPATELIATMTDALRALFPAAARAELIDGFVTAEPAATFRGRPGTRALRPGARTPFPGVLLAGAWTDTGWPATMEGAVRSGRTAAREALTGEPSPALAYEEVVL